MLGISNELIAALANTLNSSNIPCVLWGDCLLNVHGIPSAVDAVDFVVPDGQLQASIEAVSTRAEFLTKCPRSETCLVGSTQRHTPPPVFHMHMIDAPRVTLGLYRQSTTLWFLPPLMMSCSSQGPPADSHFVLASDDTVLPPWRPGRGSGVFDASQQLHRVMVPRAAVLLEAFMRIHARDMGRSRGNSAISMIAYVMLYVDEDGYLDVTQLPDPLGVVYRQLTSGEMTVRQWTKELRKVLGVSCDDGSCSD